MDEAILAGTVIGYLIYVLIIEFKLGVCRVCVVWWASVVAAIVLGNPWVIGLVNVAAHASFFFMKRFADD